MSITALMPVVTESMMVVMIMTGTLVTLITMETISEMVMLRVIVPFCMMAVMLVIETT